MSMSSLSAQLASLNGGGGKNAGSSLATSRRHEDAIGRGISHSAKHGHSLSGGSGAKHKPSVLYADSKSASDVPLTTLRENCVSSLRQLARLTENDEFVSPKYLQTLAGVHSLQFERGLATASENDKMDALIGDLLSLLSTAMGESSSTSTSCFSSSLHVLEYLLRRYDIHFRDSCMERLLICVLPFHEEPLFGRVLQLIDLARLPTFTFLRPYAAEGAPPPTRTILAKRASRDISLIKMYCDMAKSAAEIHASESDDLPRRGVSRVISFAAAVLLEALNIQTSATGSISEPALRTLLPFVLSSCGDGGSKCPDWRGFGQVLASYIAEACMLSIEAREALATNIVKGALQTEQSDVERVADCLATLMTVLSASTNETQANSSKLALLPSRKNADTRTLGYSLPVAIYKTLIKLDSLAAAVGHLYSGRNLVVSPLVASILSLATSRLPTDEATVDIFLSLIRQGQLEPLWKDPTLNLTASLSATLLKMATSLDPCADSTVEGIQSIIEALKAVCPTGCDAGIAHAVMNIGMSTQVDGNVVRQLIMRILRLDELNFAEDIDVDDATPLMLPPRVGLEHADASVRLNAIEILARDPSAVDSEGESLEQALLRHFVTEDDLKVAVAAGEALAGLLDGGSDFVSLSLVEDCLKALRKWTFLDKNSTEEQSRALEVALDIAGLAVLALGEHHHKDEVKLIHQQLLRGIIAHLNVMEAHASSALLKALGRSRDSKKNAKNLLLTTELLRNGLRSCWNDKETPANGQNKDVFFRCYLDVYSSVLVGAIGSSTKEKSKEYVSDALNACLLRVQFEGSPKAETLGQQLNTCASRIASVDTSAFLDAIMQLSLLPSKNIYEAVGITSIDRLCDGYASAHGLSKLRVLMEAALRPDAQEMCVLRFISLATDCIANKKKEISSSLTEIIVYVLALLGHAAQSVRKSALALVETASRVETAHSANTEGDKLLIAFLLSIVGTMDSASQIIMDGPSALPGYLAALVAKSNHPQKLTIELLKLCRRTACSMYTNANEEKKWLTLKEGKGGCFAAANVLKALEFSGEATAPLMCRYSHAGKDILDELLKDDTEEIPESVVDVVNCVVRMMKGVIINDAASIGSDSMIISTGPSRRGTRARSYSLSGSPGVSFIDPYPNSLYTGILSILSYTEGDAEIKKELCQALLKDVLGSPSWGEAVFKNMNRASRKKLLELLLSLWKSETIDGAGDVFLKLDLDGKDIANLTSGERMKTDLSSIIFLSDYVHAHSKRLSESAGFVELLLLLFNTLETMSSDEYMGEEEDDADFGRQSLLRVLVGLVPCADTNVSPNSKKKIPKKDLVKWATLLITLVGGFPEGQESKKMRPLPFGRPKSLSFSLLTSLCSYDPKSIAPMLVPAMLDSIIVGSNSSALYRSSSLEYRLTHEVFISVVPIFFKHANTARLNQFDLYRQFLAKVANVGQKRRTELYSCMVDAIMTVPDADLKSMSLLGSFVAASIAFDVSKSEPMETSFSVESFCEILRLSSPMALVSSLSQMIGFAYHLLVKIVGDFKDDDHLRLCMNGSTDGLEDAILFASKPSEANQRALRMKTFLTLLSIVSNLLTTSPVTTLVMQGDENASKLSLDLWRDLLLLQSASFRRSGENDLEECSEQFSEECQHLINASLEQVQSMLPAHLFLASAALLIEDCNDTELCSRAIRLVADRAAQTDSESPEASLFLDMLPTLAGCLGSLSGSIAVENAEGQMLIQQAVLVAVEIFARALCLRSSKDNGERLDLFVEFLKQASDLIKLHGAYFEQEDHVMTRVGSASCQTLCSAALCVSTLVRLLTVRSIAFLPGLVGSLISVLCSVNQALASSSDQWTAARKSHASVLQISILRPLLAIAASLPQFLGPYLDRLLSPSALLSPSLRMRDTEQQIAVSSLASQLGVSLSSKIPARQLIPSLSKSIPRCTNLAELQALLAMLKNSIQESPRNEVSSLRSWVLKSLTDAYEFCGEYDISEPTNLVTEANDVLIALVMKLSEAQLRPMYAKLREWRGNFDTDTKSSALAVRRHAFWCMSSLLSSQLRAIFLPCFSTVVSDAVDELEMAALQLSGSKKKKIDDGRKRQRLGTVDDDIVSWTFLKPLLSCLESALHADAVEGGKWVRHDDSQRYHSLLPPLAKLLELRSPFMSHESESFYQQVVHGIEGETGSVIGCLTALASAAGNEQLWKPLNRDVLHACGNETRAEVRKGGVSCLLSLIKALGEEYMVLLPECLPVLSELLEDADEHIGILAKECVTLCESLLGESLQDSLR